MKILFLTDSYPPNFGGMARSAQRIVQGISVHYEVSVCKLQDYTRNRIKDTLHAYKMKVEQLIIMDKPDLIIGFYTLYSGYIAAFMGKLFDIPSIISARGNDIERGLFDPEKVNFVSYAIHNCTHFTSVSLYLVEIARCYKQNLDYTVVFNGISTNLIFEKKQFHKDDRFIVGFFGDSREKKGLDLLLSAMELLAKINIEKWKLIIGGKIDEIAGERIRLLNQPNLKIKRVGKLDPHDIDEFYSQIHCLVIPSRYEGLPNVLLESTLRKIPVIHSDTPSMMSYFDAESVLTFRNYNFNSLANAIQHLQQQYHKINVDAAYMQLIEKYTAEKELERWYSAIQITAGSILK